MAGDCLLQARVENAAARLWRALPWVAIFMLGNDAMRISAFIALFRFIVGCVDFVKLRCGCDSVWRYVYVAAFALCFCVINSVARFS